MIDGRLRLFVKKCVVIKVPIPLLQLANAEGESVKSSRYSLRMVVIVSRATSNPPRCQPLNDKFVGEHSSRNDQMGSVKID